MYTKFISIICLLIFSNITNLLSQAFIPIQLTKSQIRNKTISGKVVKAKAAYKSRKFIKSLELLEKVEKKLPNNRYIQHNIANCMYKLARLKESELMFYELIDRGYKNNSYALYFYARSLHKNSKLKEALQYYDKYLELEDVKESHKQNVTKYKRECKVANILRNKQINMKVENLGSNINTEHKEILPMVTADESKMIFTSRRKSKLNKKKYVDYIYMSTNDGDEWSKAEILPSPINLKTNTANVAFSFDGREAFIYRPFNNGDIYRAKYRNGEWLSPEKLEGLVNTKFKESSISISDDKKTIYVVSNRKGEGITNYGRKDIFVITQDKNGDFTKIENIGPVINTRYDEEGVCIHSDNRTIFFSSKGHLTMGGFDIFFSTKDENGNWSKPKNMGHPINTPGNDIFISVTANGKSAYLSSSRDDSFGKEDIYKVTFLEDISNIKSLTTRKINDSDEEEIIELEEDEREEPELASKDIPNENNTHSNLEEKPKKKEIKTGSLALLKGTVINKKGYPLFAKIRVVDLKTNEEVRTYETDEETGEYMLTLPSGRTYGIFVSSEGYLHNSSNVKMDVNDDFQEVFVDIELAKIEKGNKIVLNNIFFEVDRFELKKESFTELNQLIKVMEENPDIKVSIEGHTDHTGSREHNLKLSRKRARSVYEYLMFSIEPERLSYKGFGYDKPKGSNLSKEGRKLNRRVEFKIIE